MDFVSAVFVELSDTATLRIKNYLLRYAGIVSGGDLKTLSGGLLQTEL
jgi:DNA repair protein RecO (recombination protein O)